MTVRDSVYLVIYLTVVLALPGFAQMLPGWDYSFGWVGGTLSTVVILHRQWYTR